jgi:homoserine dehydrogenase
MERIWAPARSKRPALIGKAEKGNNRTALTVGIEALSQDHPLFNVNSTNKAVRYITDTLGDLTVIGGASGTKPAAASILRDIINIYKGYLFV